jgi:hypothetical protein
LSKDLQKSYGEALAVALSAGVERTLKRHGAKLPPKQSAALAMEMTALVVACTDELLVKAGFPSLL